MDGTGAYTLGELLGAGFVAGAVACAILTAVYVVRQRARQRAQQAELDRLRDESLSAKGRTARQEAELGLLRDKLSSLGRERDNFRNLLNAAPISMWRRDVAGDIVWTNAMMQQILGDDPNDEEIASKSERQRPQQLVARARDEQSMAGEERRFVVDGARHVFRVFESPLLSDTESAGFAIDITQTDDLRRELRRQIHAHNEVLERQPTAIAIYDREKRLIFSNRAYKITWGLDDEFLASAPTLGEMLDRLSGMRKLPETSDYRQFKQSRESLFTTLIDPVEDLYQRPDERMMRETIARHSFGGLTFMFEDATDRIVMERNLNTYIAVQRATLDNLHEAVAVFGPDGRLGLFNKGYRDMMGLPADMLDHEPHVREIVDHALAQGLLPAENPEMRERLIASATETRSGSGRMNFADGRIVDYAANGLPDGRTLFTYLDVTAATRVERALRERNEALVAADLIKSEFLENMSYELRTPLNTILGFAEILHNDYFGPLNDRQREYSGGILEASDQFLSMINDMLDLASIQAGHMQVDETTFDVGEAIETVVTRYQDRAERRQIRLLSELPGQIPQAIGDPRRVEQVIGNLLSNALKFTPPGGTVTVTARSDTGIVDICVADDGIGIPEEEQARVFETFRTSDRHTRRGAGLGLALVRNLTELMGGTVMLESESGVGTTVTCRLLAATAGEEGAARFDAGPDGTVTPETAYDAAALSLSLSGDTPES